MSVLIKGMEMPKDCFECPWRCKVDPENLLCRISGEYFEETFSGTIQNRHKSCPLVPVPPHGRLGDLDALARQIEHERFHHTHTDGLAARHHVAEYGHFLKAISEAPTIIPAEEGE